jgi:hypothetical protein
MKCAATAGTQENSKQMHQTNLFTVPSERRNKSEV